MSRPRISHPKSQRFYTAQTLTYHTERLTIQNKNSEIGLIETYGKPNLLDGPKTGANRNHGDGHLEQADCQRLVKRRRICRISGQGRVNGSGVVPKWPDSWREAG